MKCQENASNDLQFIQHIPESMPPDTLVIPLLSEILDLQLSGPKKFTPVGRCVYLNPMAQI